MFKITAHIRRLTVTTLFALLTLLVVHPVLAQGGHTFRLLPDPGVTSSSNRAYFVYESSPGTAMSDAVLVKNRGNEAIRLALYPADAITGSNGGVAVATQLGDTPSHAGTWIQLSESEITLQPGEERSVPFNINIPDGMAPGEYGATIVAQPAERAESEAQSGPVGIRFIPRTAATVLLTIPGPQPLQSRLEITSLRAETDNTQEIIADLRNAGNDGLDKTQGTLTIRDANGTLVQEIPLQLGYFLAGDTLTYRAGIEPELAAGEYDIALTLNYQDQTVEQTIRLSLDQAVEVPLVIKNGPPVVKDTLTEWLIAAGFAIVLVLLLLIIIVWRQLKRSQQAIARQGANMSG